MQQNMKFKKYKLVDIAKIEISGVDKKTVDGETPVRLCNFVDVYRNWAITKVKAENFMSASAKGTEIERFSISRGQVAITKDSETRYDIGIPTYISDDFENVLLGYHCALITPNETIVDGKYLNAFMHTKYIQKYFEHNASGSGQRYTLSNDTINSIPVLLPSIDIQHAIGKILSDIDRKIELNRQINDNLEAMAKQLYDYWFVQFDFPNEEGKPYKSSGGEMVWNNFVKQFIPHSWRVCKIKDLLPVITGKQDANFATKNGKYKFFTCSQEVSNCNIAEFEGSAVLIAGNGDFNVKHYTGPFNAYQRTYVLVPPTKFYAVIFMATSMLLEQFKKNSNGSIIKFITKGDVENITIFDCGGDALYNRLNNLFFMIEQNNKEIEFLTKQRDELLPLLMNGQATINYHLSDD